MEITIPTKFAVLRAEVAHEDFYAAIDLTIDKLEDQIRRQKTRLERKHKDKLALAFIEDDDNADEDVFVKTKSITVTEMDLEEAIMRMEMLGHDFFIYKDEETKETMVILKSTVVAADYDTACEFYDEYTVLREFAEKLKQEHPRYGEKRVRETLLELVRTADCYQDRTLCAEQIVGAYLTFEKCGFNEVKELETEANKLGIKLANSVDTVKTGTIDNTVETVNRTM